MTNIEKLYELAGLEKIGKKYSCEALDFGACKKAYCSVCEKAKIKNYPPFTDTKQLELIKLISSEFTVRINSNKDSTFIMLMQSAKTFLWASDDKFEQALAKLVCELWEYLKKEAKEEIKRILE